jgi:hypothetical protein
MTAGYESMEYGHDELIVCDERAILPCFIISVASNRNIARTEVLDAEDPPAYTPGEDPPSYDEERAILPRFVISEASNRNIAPNEVLDAEDPPEYTPREDPPTHDETCGSSYVGLLF